MNGLNESGEASQKGNPTHEGISAMPSNIPLEVDVSTQEFPLP